MCEVEVWAPIPGYGGHYEASNLGQIRVKDRVVVKKHSTSGKPESFFYKGRNLSPCNSSKHGHKGVTFGFDGVVKRLSVHRLILLAFVGPCPEGMEACHNNGNAGDNRLSNLRWDTHHNNNQDRKRHGTYPNGEAHPMAKITAEQVLSVRARRLQNAAIMAELGVSRSHAQRIRTGQSWSATA
jgi:hypothetical protein